ncbi:hypothetical protein VTK73DRAFT_2930 [Phialemonium thermophilum]|uniref:Uncharacterized protein n=1 Tax=Phialemonium thermophilum TaxID=223376 RepID=A0ABR3VMY9_9PEZI
MKLLVHLAFWLGSVSALRWIKTERRGAMARGRGMVPRAAVDSVGVTGFDEERWAVGAPRSFRTELVGRDLETAPTLSAREPSLDASGPPVAESQNSDLDFYECQNAVSLAASARPRLLVLSQGTGQCTTLISASPTTKDNQRRHPREKEISPLTVPSRTRPPRTPTARPSWTRSPPWTSASSCSAEPA